ncbi:MAG: hypothetical protein ACXWT1_10855 [Methylobacter sp.]
MRIAVKASPWSFGRIAKCAAIALLLFAIAYASWLYWLFEGGVFSTSNFEPSVWYAKQTSETVMSCFRGGMANDLKNRVLQPGFSQSAVMQILGEPDGMKPAEFEYILGMCSGFGIDYDSINIYFNGRGELIHVAIFQH